MKKRFTRIIACIALAALVTSLTACGSKEKTSGSNAGTTSNDKATFEPVEWRMSNQHPDGSIADTADKEMIEEIRKATEGRVNITLYNNNQLGDYLSVFDEVMVGSIQIHHGSTNEGYDSRVLGPFLPYLATGYDTLSTVYSPDGYLFKTLHDDVYTKLGMELMGFFCEGFDGVGTQKPVTNAAEVGADKGVLIRVPAMETFNQCNLMLGFRTTSIPYTPAFRPVWLTVPPVCPPTCST